MAQGAVAKDPLVGLKLGDYVVEAPVGFGGMGIVYRAVHPLIGRKVAVKVLRPEWASDPEQTQRFLAEAQALSAIKHRGIIDIISFGHVPDGRQYMVMEFLDGESLEALMEREAPMSPAAALPLVDEVLDALSAAHRVGVVHRDLKPSNVFLLRQSNNTRVVKLVDFGLARRASLADLNRVGAKASLMAGTPEYLAPEQARGQAATPRTDLYGLGVVVFEMLAGRLPFLAGSVTEYLAAHTSQQPPRLSTLTRSVPEELDELVARLLEKAPQARPASADAVRQSVQRILKQLREQETHVAVTPSSVGPTEQTLAGVPARDHDTDRVPGAGTEPVERTVEATKSTQRAEPRGRSRVVWLGAAAVAVAALAGVGALAKLRGSHDPQAPRAESPAPVEPAPPAASGVAGTTVPAADEPVATDVPPASDDDELSPLKNVNGKPQPVKPPVTRAGPKPPAVCSSRDWASLLKVDLDHVTQAVVKVNPDPTAREPMKLVNKALRDLEDKRALDPEACATYARRIAAWKRDLHLK